MFRQCAAQDNLILRCITVPGKLYLVNYHISLQDIIDSCPGLNGDITHYQISFQTVSTVATENVNIAKCTGGRCSHTFEPPSNPPSSYDSVSVAAENVVGVGAARTCTTQTISELQVT